jgi:hypothetical protein
MRLFAAIGGVAALVLCGAAGCGSSDRSQTRTGSLPPANAARPDIVTVQHEALRLLEEHLGHDGHVGQVSRVEAKDANTRTYLVTFSDVTDTVAEVTIDARSGHVVSSSIGGGL